MEIFKDERIKKVLEKIKNAIKLTHFDGKVYVGGGAVRDALLGLPVKDLDIVVEYKGGGLMVANLLAAKERCYVCGSNPVVYETYGTAKVSLFATGSIKGVWRHVQDTHHLRFSQIHQPAVYIDCIIHIRPQTYDKKVKSEK